MSFGALGFAGAHADNVSISGIGLSLTCTSAGALLKPGRTVNVEVYDNDEPVFRAPATVRHCTGARAGLEWEDLIPEELLPAVT